MGNSRPESKNPHKTMILWGLLLFLDMSREEFLADRGGAITLYKSTTYILDTMSRTINCSALKKAASS